jgi:hypothetical protein
MEMRALINLVRAWGLPIGLILAWIAASAYTVYALQQAVYASGYSRLGA